MDRLQLTEAELGQKLGVTQQAINKWRRTGVVPMRQYRALIDVLGADSEIAALGEDGLFAAKMNRNVLLEQAVATGSISEDERNAIIYRSQPEPGAQVRDMRRARGLLHGGFPASAALADKNFVVRAGVAQAAAADEQLRKMLPAPLRKAMASPRGPDYISHRLALEVREAPRMGPLRLTGAVLRVAAAKARSPELRAVVAVLANSDPIISSALKEDAQALGVEIWVVDNVETLAQSIIQAESDQTVVAVDEDEAYD